VFWLVWLMLALGQADSSFGICPYTCTDDVVERLEDAGYEVNGLRNLLFFPAYLMVRDGESPLRCALFPGFFMLAVLSGYKCFTDDL
jgi:hypothetical protein